MKRFWVLVCLLIASPVFAQTHYCDTTQASSTTAVTGTPLTYQICVTNKDANGNPITVTGLALYDNGTRTTPTFVKGTTSTTSGKTEWDLTFTAPSAASVHTYQSGALSAQGESLKSPPFVLTVNLPLTVPDAPTNPFIHP